MLMKSLVTLVASSSLVALAEAEKTIPAKCLS